MAYAGKARAEHGGAEPVDPSHVTVAGLVADTTAVGWLDAVVGSDKVTAGRQPPSWCTAAWTTDGPDAGVAVQVATNRLPKVLVATSTPSTERPAVDRSAGPLHPVLGRPACWTARPSGRRRSSGPRRPWWCRSGDGEVRVDGVLVGR